MKAIRTALADVAKRLGIQNARRVKLRQHWRVLHRLTIHAHNVALRQQAKADEARTEGRLGAAAYHDRRAIRAHARAEHRHLKAEHVIGLLKRVNQRIENLSHRQADLQAEAKKWKATHGVEVSGNTVTGGHARERIKVCMLSSAAKCASGARSNFYSQTGSWDVDHCITGEPYGHRSDCSSWATSVYRSCGLDDPNDNGYRGGYTGTWRGKNVGESGRKCGTGVLFGYAPYHHIELCLGADTIETVGHGSAPVDKGTIHLLPGPVSFIDPLA